MIWAPYQAIDREPIWVALFDTLKAKLWAPPYVVGAVGAGAVVTDPQGHLQKALGSGVATGVATWNDSGGTTADGAGGTAFEWQDTGAGVVSIGRKHKAPPALGLAEQPALFVLGVKETQIPNKPAGAPTKLILHGFLILYLQAPAVSEDIGTETVLGATEMNALLYAIDQAFQPDNPTTGRFTLGGLVTHCWIEGDSDLDPGILGTQAAALIRVHILVP